jgi:hypothetical protein
VSDDLDDILGDFLGTADERLTRVEHKLAPLALGRDDE